MRYINEEPFHSKASIYQAMEVQRRGLHNEINGIPEQRLRSTAIEALTASLAEKYSMNIPILDEESATPSKREIDIDMSRNPSRQFLGGPSTVKGTEITIVVPYSGDKEIFRHHASSHAVEYPTGHIGEATISFVRRGANLDPARVRLEFDAWVARIKEHLEGMRKELGNFNESITAEIRSKLETRLSKVNKDDELLDGLGFRGTKR
jgi:hypothetical protein